MSYGIAVASAHPVDRSADGALSIIVVTFNSSPVVTELLDSIQERLNGAEIIVCDNGSTDGTIDLAQSHASRPRVVAIGKNLGFGAAANAGARAATASLLLVINPDSRIVDVRREPLAVLAAQRPFGIRACAIETGKGRVHLLHERWGWRRELAWNLWRAFLNPRWVQLGRPKSRREPRNPWVSGAAFLVRRDEFLEIGGFDERYFLYGEDIDLSATYAQAALPVTRTSAIAVEHEGGGSSDVPVVNLTVWSELSLLEFTAKWSGEGHAVQAARLVLRSLSTIARLAYLFSRTPIVGRRVRRVGLRASVIRAELAAIPLRDPVTFPWYPLARRALSAVSVAAEGDSG